MFTEQFLIKKGCRYSINRNSIAINSVDNNAVDQPINQPINQGVRKCDLGNVLLNTKRKLNYTGEEKEEIGNTNNTNNNTNMVVDDDTYYEEPVEVSVQDTSPCNHGGKVLVNVCRFICMFIVGHVYRSLVIMICLKIPEVCIANLVLFLNQFINIYNTNNRTIVIYIYIWRE